MKEQFSGAEGTFISTTLGAAMKLLDEMMINYSQWHTERSPTGKKVNFVEEISALNEKVDLIMSLLTKQAPIDPHDVPLNSFVAQEQVDVNFISRNNFNNNASRNREFPSYEKLMEIEKATKNYVHTQFEQNKAFSRQLDEHSS